MYLSESRYSNHPHLNYLIKKTFPINIYELQVLTCVADQILRFHLELFKPHRLPVERGLYSADVVAEQRGAAPAAGHVFMVYPPQIFGL